MGHVANVLKEADSGTIGDSQLQSEFLSRLRDQDKGVATALLEGRNVHETGMSTRALRTSLEALKEHASASMHALNDARDAFEKGWGPPPKRSERKLMPIFAYIARTAAEALTSLLPVFDARLQQAATASLSERRVATLAREILSGERTIDSEVGVPEMKRRLTVLQDYAFDHLARLEQSAEDNRSAEGDGAPPSLDSELKPLYKCLKDVAEAQLKALASRTTSASPLAPDPGNPKDTSSAARPLPPHRRGSAYVVPPPPPPPHVPSELLPQRGANSERIPRKPPMEVAEAKYAVEQDARSEIAESGLQIKFLSGLLDQDQEKVATALLRGRNVHETRMSTRALRTSLEALKEHASASMHALNDARDAFEKGWGPPPKRSESKLRPIFAYIARTAAEALTSLPPLPPPPPMAALPPAYAPPVPPKLREQ